MLSRRAGTWLVLSLCLTAGATRAQDQCQPDTQCRFKKPNILIVLDYSSSMVGSRDMPAYYPATQMTTTRWLAELNAVTEILSYDRGFFANNARLGLARFAHDPVLRTAGTTIGTDVSFPPITDGFAVDVPFNASTGTGYLECRGSGVEAEVELLRTTPPPVVDNFADPTKVMLTWTRGALLSAHELVRRTRESHLGEPGEETRDYEVVLMTDGDWTDPEMLGQSPEQNPAPAAAALRQDGVRVHVVAFGDATRVVSLDEVALQGGTGSSIEATSPKGLVTALGSALDTIRASVIVPECTRGLPRILVIMDGSSSMIEGSAPGETKWDKARFALGGNPQAPDPGDPGYVQPVFDRRVEVGGREVAIEDVVHLGLVSFAEADNQTQMVGFGPCMRDNFAWAMDPATSCEAPGCTDPYAGYPIEWTFKDSAVDRDPPFVRATLSYMPACNETPGQGDCVGEIPNTFTGQGLEFAEGMIRAYKASSSPFPIDDRTPFINVLITDGQTSSGSSDVRAILSDMVRDGIDTYVIGFGSAGELDEAQLEQYATWGNTDRAIIVDPTRPGGAEALADALAAVVTGLDLDGCCVLDDCSEQAEPADPKPVCGDGRIEGEEICDDGPLNASYGHCGARCDGPHLICGDGRTDSPEQCDDGNSQTGDGCDAFCLRENELDPVAEDGGLVVPPSLNRPPVPRPDGGVSAPAPAPGAAAGSFASPAGPRMMPAPPSPKATGGGGCSAAPGAPDNAAWLLGLGLFGASLRRRHRLLADRVRATVRVLQAE